MRKAEHLDDLMPFLVGTQVALWDGTDEEFARGVQDLFGIPVSINLITITPRTAKGIAAVSIGGPDGAIVFILRNDNVQQVLHVEPTLMGPISQNRDVINRANAAAGGGEISDLVVGVIKRHLPPANALELLIPNLH